MQGTPASSARVACAVSGCGLLPNNSKRNRAHGATAGDKPPPGKQRMNLFVHTHYALRIMNYALHKITRRISHGPLSPAKSAASQNKEKTKEETT